MHALPRNLLHDSRLAPSWPMLLRQTWCEILLQVRMPMGLVWALIVTPMLFLFLGLGYAGQDVAGVDGQTYMMGSFATLGTFNIMLSTFAGGVASDRGARRHVLYRATPVRPAVLLGAKVITACIMTAVMSLLVIGVAVAAGTRIDVLDGVSLVARMIVGGLPIIAMGLAVGYLVRPSSVAVAINVIYLGLSFISGIYVPIPVTGGALQPIASFSPMSRLGELAWNAVGAETAHTLVGNLAVLAIYGLIFGIIALKAYGREEKRTFE
jgi:ABC-2 type transport system permease protein